MSDDKIRYSYSPKFLDLLMKNSNGRAFRKKVEPCPYCEPDCGMFEKPKFATEWDKEGIVREIVFIRNQMGPYYKKGYVIMVSACPRCKKLSFHHRIITQLPYDDWADKKIVQAEIDVWKQESIDEWNNSLCVRCAVKREVEKDPWGYVVDCDKGHGSLESPWETEAFRCKKFTPVNPDTCEYCGKKVKGEEKHEKVHKECQEKMDEIERISYNEWLRRMHNLGWHKDKKERRRG